MEGVVIAYAFKMILISLDVFYFSNSTTKIVMKRMLTKLLHSLSHQRYLTVLFTDGNIGILQFSM